jgi:hypothetical protein
MRQVAMITLRLYLDGRGQAWAVVQCDRCGEVHKYPAQLALAAPIPCAHCRTPMDVGATLMAEMNARANDFPSGVFDRTGTSSS